MSALTSQRSLINWSSMPAGRTDEWHQYIATIKPTYDHLIRLAGQVSGMLILSESESRLEVLLSMPLSLSEQADEIKGSLLRIKPPMVGVDHFQHLLSSALKLTSLASTLEAQTSCGTDPSETHIWHGALAEALDLLKCASDPWSGLQPVQFEGCCACCTH
jgi:hypothetical protein